jgi:micrococcal nuclease
MRWIIVVMLFALGLATHQLAHQEAAAILPATPAPSVASGFVYVSRAVDGDTLELADGTLVRYLAIDTPETIHPKKPVQCYGPEASAYNKSLVEGRPVRLVRDKENTDMYGRLLPYIYLEDGTFVNLKLVADGYAKVYTVPPNIAHTRELQAAEAIAKAQGRGLWNACVSR